MRIASAAVAGVVERASIREPQHVPKRVAWRDRVHRRHSVDVYVSDVLDSADVDGGVMSIGDLHRFDVIACRDDLRVAHASEACDVGVVIAMRVRDQNRIGSRAQMPVEFKGRSCAYGIPVDRPLEVM